MTMETPKWLLLEVETWDYGDYALGFLVATTSATGKHPSYIDRLPRHFPNLPSIQGWDMTCDEKYANMASRKKRATIATSSKHHGIASSKRSLTYPLGIMFIVEIPELNDFPKPPFFWWISHHARFELPFRVGSMTFKRLAPSVTWFHWLDPRRPNFASLELIRLFSLFSSILRMYSWQLGSWLRMHF